MPLNTEAIGKQWPPQVYEVGSEKIREFSDAIGAGSDLHRDREAALAAGYRGIVAPPMFCVVYCARSMGPAILDPAVGIDLAAMVHGGQEFRWEEPVCAGDTVTTTVHCSEIYDKDGKGFYLFETLSVNQDEQPTVHGTWTNIVRGV
ncbi:MAG: MaoC family dehydratase N-terminal domain-containing protein [Solirubrobacterales bacterium]